MGGEELKCCHPLHHKLRSQQGPHFSPHRTAKRTDKITFLSSSISDVVIASVHTEKKRLKKLMMMKMIIILNKSQ